MHRQQDIDLDQDLDHYDMKEEEPVDGKKSEDDGIEKENLAILEKIRKNQRQDHLNVSSYSFLLNMGSLLYPLMKSFQLPYLLLLAFIFGGRGGQYPIYSIYSWLASHEIQ